MMLMLICTLHIINIKNNDVIFEKLFEIEKWPNEVNYS